MLRPADAHPCATAQQPGRKGKAKEAEEVKEAEEAKLTIDNFGLTIVFRLQMPDTQIPDSRHVHFSLFEVSRLQINIPVRRRLHLRLRTADQRNLVHCGIM